MSSIENNLISIKSEIDKACRQAGRGAESVRLIVVTKAASIDQVREVVSAGVMDLGENKVQDALRKVGSIDGQVCWHFIGHLQRNKVRAVVGFAGWIHSMDSLRLAQAIDEAAYQIGKQQDVLLQVNVAGEESKYGVSIDEVADILDELMVYQNIKVRGLMTIAPLGDSSGASDVFGMLKAIFDRETGRTRPGMALDQLSMGMSQDFREAVAAGSTMVRIGSAVFRP